MESLQIQKMCNIHIPGIYLSEVVGKWLVLYQSITKGCEMYVHTVFYCWFRNVIDDYCLYVFIYILCAYPETLWRFTVSCWHFSLPRQCHFFQEVNIDGGSACLWGLEAICSQTHLPHYSWSFPLFPSSHYKMHITFIIIFHYFRSKIHHCWCFEKLAFDIAFTKIICHEIHDSIMNSAPKAYTIIHTWWLSCPDEYDGKNTTDLMRLI